MNKNQINFIAGLLLVFLCFRIFVGSGIFDRKIEAQYQPQVTAGKLSAEDAADQANFAATAWETFYAVISSIGGIAIFLFTKAASRIQQYLFPNQPDTPVGRDSQSRLDDDMARMLLHAISEADKELTIILAEKLAKTPFLSTNKSSTVK